MERKTNMKKKTIQIISAYILIAIYFALVLNNSFFVQSIEGFCVGICSVYAARKFANWITKKD